MPNASPKQCFLWPESQTTNLLKTIFKPCSISELEKSFEKLFPDGHAVITSSGRAALILALMGQRLSRQDLVGVFPYASHCVLESVAKITTPLCGTGWDLESKRIVFHQWGYVQDIQDSSVIIDDAADSLCDVKANLFPSGSDYEVWSLPKSFGVLTGGILWCRNESDAVHLRNERDKHGSCFFHFITKLFASTSPLIKDLAYCYASTSLALHPLAASQIQNKLDSLTEIANDRRMKYNLLNSHSPSWLPAPVKNRLPCVVPVDISEEKANMIEALGLNAGFRNFALKREDGNTELKRIYPIPIHQQVPLSLINRVIQIIETD